MSDRASGAAAILQNVDRSSDLWVVIATLDQWGFTVADTRFSVWTVLVVGTLVGAFFLLRDLYRKGKALVHELGRASDLLADVADRAEELAATTTTSPAPVDLTDPEPARARRAASQEASRARQARRAERHEAAHRRWAAFSR